MPKCRTVVALGGVTLVIALPALAVAAPSDGPGPWMDTVVSARQGATFDGLPVVAARSVLASALGVAEQATSGSSFYSLGFGGSITLRSDTPICNGPGADIRVLEVTLGLSGSDERAAIDVSADGRSWTRIAGSLARSGDVGLPADLPAVRFVRVTDVTPLTELTRRGADGYDLDGTGALHPSSLCGGPTSGTTTSAASIDPSRTTASGTVPVETPPTAPSRAMATPPARLPCGAQRLLIQDLARTGRRLRVVGVADASLVGRRVVVRSTGGGAPLGSALVAADGSFALTTRAVPPTSALRVVAAVGDASATPVRVSRRLVTRSVAVRGGYLRWSGRVIGAIPTSGVAVVLSRRTGCGAFERVGQTRTRASGGFSMSVPAPRTGSYVFRLTSSVARSRDDAARVATSSLPRGLTFGG